MKISSIIVSSFLNLVLRRRLILVSRIDLVMKRSAIFPLVLQLQRYRSVWAATQTRGISWAPSATNSSLRRLDGDTSASYCLMVLIRLDPTSFVLTQLKKQCSRSARTGKGHVLHWSEEFGRILASLCSVGRSLWSNLQRKLVASDPRPFSLARLQLNSQSVLGENSSALDLMNSLVLASTWTMVTSCSSSTLYHLAVVIVAMFKGVLSLTNLID